MKYLAWNIFNSRFQSTVSKIGLIKRWRKCFYIKNNFCSIPNENNELNIPIERIRNFSIIAHVDHGKSTLADRILEMTGAIKVNSGMQVLDKLQVEKERGITVKAQTVSLIYKYNGTDYLLNLIDTPGHVDFAAEVQRSLAPCQGVILLVDANDGVQAQTVANFYLAFEKNLVIIPVLNKIDLKNSDPDRVTKQLNTLFDIESNEVLKISAKLGKGIETVLDRVIEKVPPPMGSSYEPLQALIFDCWYDKYKGAIILVYLKNGTLSVGDHITSIHTKKTYEVRTLFLLRPEEKNIKTLHAGQVGCITCNMRSVKEAHIGDTVHLKDKPVEPLIGFKPVKPMVFAGVYPIDQSHFIDLQNAIERLILNDSSVQVVPENSAALGRGWRIGFLGILHMEVFIQRLEQEYGAQPILTAPNVTYKATIRGKKNIIMNKGDTILFNNPLHFPEVSNVVEFFEPKVIGTIITPDIYIGKILALCMEKRGVERSTQNIDNKRVMLQFDLPLNEIILDFNDTLKRLSSGYASFDYEDNGYEATKIIKLNIALNGNVVEELSTIVHITKATEVGKRLCAKLVEILPRQQFEIAIQAMAGVKVVARETLKAYRKDVTAKLYGGDVTRRKKLLSKQAEGKKKLRMIGNISVPRETFINILKR